MERRSGKRQQFSVILSERDAVLFEAGLIKLDASKLKRTATFQKKFWFRKNKTIVQEIVFQEPKITGNLRLPDGRLEVYLDCVPVLIRESEVKG